MRDFFPHKEFTQCNPPCNKGDMNEEFMAKLNKARSISGVPYVLTSAYRTVSHEYRQGRDGTSSHTKGLAVDIATLDSRTRILTLKGLIDAGFTRIGLGKDFIHVDDDDEKSQNVLWHYYK